MTDSTENYGPLQGFIGLWRGERGLDVAPEPTETARSPFWETIEYVAAGDVDNADRQVLMVVRYHHQVYRQSNDKQFHDQVGYLTWEPATGTITNSFAIPRGVTVVAMGQAKQLEDGSYEIVMSCDLENPDGGISQSPFMRDNAKTVSFSQTFQLKGDELSYKENMGLFIYGKDFDHVDKSQLTRQK